MDLEITSMNVCFLIGNITRLGGGVSEALAGLTRALSQLGVNPTLIARNDPYVKKDCERFGKVPILLHQTRGISRYPISFCLKQVLASVNPDIIHLHGIWAFESFVVRRYCELHGTPLVVSPHGMLDPWILNKSRLLKQIMYRLNEKALLSRADILHALSSNEAESIAALGFREKLVEIPNGVELSPDSGAVLAVKQSLPEYPKRFVYLGRLDSKKNVHGLIEGWKIFWGRLRPGATLAIAGWGSDRYRARLELLVGDNPDKWGISFVGPLYGDSKTTFLRNAHFTVLPSFSEGLPMVPLESWAQATPIIMSHLCNMEFAFTEGLALCSGTEPNQIAEALAQGYFYPRAKRLEAGNRGFAKISEEYSWNSVAETWLRLYQSFRSEGCETSSAVELFQRNELDSVRPMYHRRDSQNQ